MRRDRAVEIPRKELTDLVAELHEFADMFEQNAALKKKQEQQELQQQQQQVPKKKRLSDVPEVALSNTTVSFLLK